MTLLEIFGAQFALSLVALSVLAVWIVGPWLAKKPTHDALFYLAAPHAFRHLGLVFLVPGVVAPSLPEYFANPAAYGDLIAGLLAIATMVALKRRWMFAIPLAWALNIVGVADLANALAKAEVIPHLHAAWYIPTFVVPLLLTTHAMMLWRLGQELISPKARSRVSA